MMWHHIRELFSKCEICIAFTSILWAHPHLSGHTSTFALIYMTSFYVEVNTNVDFCPKK